MVRSLNDDDRRTVAQPQAPSQEHPDAKPSSDLTLSSVTLSTTASSTVGWSPGSSHGSPICSSVSDSTVAPDRFSPSTVSSASPAASPRSNDSVSVEAAREVLRCESHETLAVRIEFEALQVGEYAPRNSTLIETNDPRASRSPGVDGPGRSSFPHKDDENDSPARRSQFRRRDPSPFSFPSSRSSSSSCRSPDGTSSRETHTFRRSLPYLLNHSKYLRKWQYLRVFESTDANPDTLKCRDMDPGGVTYGGGGLSGNRRVVVRFFGIPASWLELHVARSLPRLLPAISASEQTEEDRSTSNLRSAEQFVFVPRECVEWKEKIPVGYLRAALTGRTPTASFSTKRPLLSSSDDLRVESELHHLVVARWCFVHRRVIRHRDFVDSRSVCNIENCRK